MTRYDQKKRREERGGRRKKERKGNYKWMSSTNPRKRMDLTENKITEARRQET